VPEHVPDTGSEDRVTHRAGRRSPLLAHYVSLGYAIIAGLLGTYMGALLLLTGNLFVAMAVHALFDFAALLFISRMTLSPVTEPGLP
jgi:membrane protease YdiL (CAAX protease family)